MPPWQGCGKAHTHLGPAHQLQSAQTATGRGLERTQFVARILGHRTRKLHASQLLLAPLGPALSAQPCPPRCGKEKGRRRQPPRLVANQTPLCSPGARQTSPLDRLMQMGPDVFVV
jgi:hypothetical protein